MRADEEWMFVIACAVWLLMILTLCWSQGIFSIPYVVPQETSRLCPVEGEVLQLPCKHVHWMGNA
jgi:hypothetical protein